MAEWLNLCKLVKPKVKRLITSGNNPDKINNLF